MPTSEIGRRGRLAGLGLAAALGLAGCEDLDLDLSLLEAPAGPQRVAVQSGAVQVAGPRGFCVDTDATRDGATGAFVVLGPCGIIAGAGPDVAPAILIASIGRPRPDPFTGVSDEALRSFASTAEGRRALSLSGRADNVEIREVARRGDVVHVAITDANEGPLLGTDPSYRRALLPIEGRLAALTVLGAAGGPLDDAEAGRLAQSFANALKRANR